MLNRHGFCWRSLTRTSKDCAGPDSHYAKWLQRLPSLGPLWKAQCEDQVRLLLAQDVPAYKKQAKHIFNTYVSRIRLDTAYEDLSDSSTSDLDMDEESHSDVDSDGYINSSSSENSD